MNTRTTPLHLLLAFSLLGAATSAGTLSSAATAAPMASVSAPTSKTVALNVANGSFTNGTNRWRDLHGPNTTFKATYGGQTGLAARVVAKGPGVARMGIIHRPQTVRSTERDTDYTFTGEVRTTAPMNVEIKVVESNRARKQVTRDRIRVQPHTWVRATTQAKAKLVNSSMRVSFKALSPSRGDVLRVDDVSASQVVQVESEAPGTCGFTRRGLPLCGAYLGASVGLNADPKRFEQNVGGRLAIRRTFFRGHQVSGAVATARSDLALGRVPWISFKFPHSWAAMARGDGDAWARDIAKRLGELDGPVWIAFHHEPEKDGNIAQWRRTQERLAPIVRSTAPNVAYTVIVMGFHQVTGGSLNSGQAPYGFANLWPATKIDVLGIDPYNYHGVPGRSAAEPADLTKQYFEPVGRWAERRNVAWGVAETGFTETSFAVERSWIQNTYDGLRANGGIAMSYFNSAPSNASGDWVLDTQPRLDAYRRVLEDTVRLAR